MPTEALTVKLAERAYPIHFSDSLRALQNDVAGLRAAGRSVTVLSDANVLKAQPSVLTQAGFKHEEILQLPAGEPSKSIAYFSHALSFLAKQAANRDCALFAFGGGVVGDLSGYVAASYLRGIDFYQIPTTLLSMVDSSVGGKTGINLPEGKNLVGAFWQPKAVYIQTKLLNTLPPREFAAGMAEVIKYGMLHDVHFFRELEQIERLTARSPQLAGIIRRCCAIKAAIVVDDEQETAASGGRALLNLGHSFAHAIENVAGYGDVLHGEAVAIGLHLATRLSVQLGQLDADDIDRVLTLIERNLLPTELKSALPIAALMAAMRRDKKNRSRRLRLISMLRLGQAVTTDAVDPAVIEALWKTVGAQ